MSAAGLCAAAHQSFIFSPLLYIIWSFFIAQHCNCCKSIKNKPSIKNHKKPILCCFSAVGPHETGCFSPAPFCCLTQAMWTCELNHIWKGCVHAALTTSIYSGFISDFLLSMHIFPTQMSKVRLTATRTWNTVSASVSHSIPLAVSVWTGVINSLEGFFLFLSYTHICNGQERRREASWGETHHCSHVVTLCCCCCCCWGQFAVFPTWVTNTAKHYWFCEAQKKQSPSACLTSPVLMHSPQPGIIALWQAAYMQAAVMSVNHLKLRGNSSIASDCILRAAPWETQSAASGYLIYSALRSGALPTGRCAVQQARFPLIFQYTVFHIVWSQTRTRRLRNHLIPP